MSEKPPFADNPDASDNPVPAAAEAPSGGLDASRWVEAAPKLDIGNIKDAIDQSLSPKTISIDLFNEKSTGSGKAENMAEIMGELAEDMVSLFKMVSALDAKMSQVISTVASLQETLATFSRSIGMEVYHLKEDLISDRKEYISRSTFNVLMPIIESLKTMKRFYENKEQAEEALKNTNTMLDLLTGITQALRYAPFEVQTGAEFDPQTMECTGYEEGESGKVIRIERAGYKAGHILVRPCLVTVGQSPQKDDAGLKKDTHTHTSKGATK